MSRTIKGSKSVGYDFWSKRGHGPIIKNMTHRVERRIKKDTVRKELGEWRN